MTRCGRATRSGGVCQLQLRAGKCLTHDSNLKKRNRKVLRSWRKRDPEAFRAQRVNAGKLGYAVTLMRHGDIASRKAAEWRKLHPSKPENFIRQWLNWKGIEAEWEEPIGKYYVDIRLVEPPHSPRVIEMNGHQAKPSFGESEPREERQSGGKIKDLENAGFKVFVFNWLSEREPEIQRLENWLKSTRGEGAEQ